MKNPNRKDLRKLNCILSMVQKLQYAYDGLSLETQTFLLEEFHGETAIHLRDFEQNIEEAIEELKKPKLRIKKS